MSCPREGKKGERNLSSWVLWCVHSFEPSKSFPLWLCWSSVVLKQQFPYLNIMWLGSRLCHSLPSMIQQCWCSLNGKSPCPHTGHHSFELTTFDKPSFCDVCHKLLHGCYFQGYMCSSELLSSQALWLEHNIITDTHCTQLAIDLCTETVWREWIGVPQCSLNVSPT